jgi:hypothetical protein
MASYLSVMRTQYVYALLVDRDQKQAEQLRRGFERRARSYPYPSDVESERELMDIARRRAAGELDLAV